MPEINVVEESISVSKSQLAGMIAYTQDLEAEIKRLKTNQSAVLSVLISLKDKLGLNEMAHVKSISAAIAYSDKYWFFDTLKLIKEVMKSQIKGAFTGENTFDISQHLRINFAAFTGDFEAVMPIITEWDAEYSANKQGILPPNSPIDGTPS